MKALVISGGGSKGAWAGGVVEYLINTEGKDYDMYFATSTGSLMVPLIAANELSKLKHNYLSVTQDKIFKLNPFKLVSNKNGVIKTNMNYLNIFRNIVLNGQNSFGDSSKLRDNIEVMFDETDYEYIIKNKKDVTVCVSNITLGQKEYKSISDEGMSYCDFCDWIYASACATPFMSVVEKNGYEYVDGGFVEHVPIQEAIDRGATEIDVIDLIPKEGTYHPEKIRNPLHLIYRMFELSLEEIRADDIKIAKLRSKGENIILNIYNTPRRLTNNPLIFDSEVMSKWWDEGYDVAYNAHCRTYSLEGRRKPKLTHDGTYNES